MELFLQRGCKEAHKQCRDNGTLITVDVQRQGAEDKVQRFRHAVDDVPFVGQVRRYQHQTENNAQNGGAAKLFAGRPGHQNGDKGIGGVGQYGINGIEFRGKSHAESADQQAAKPHEDTGSQQYRDDGNEDVRNHFSHTLEGDFVRTFSRFFAIGQADQLAELGTDFIYKAGAQNDLVLPALAKIPCNAGNLFHGLLIHKGRIFQPHTQAGGTVRGTGDIFLAAESCQNRLRGGNGIFFHNVNLHIQF